jgi:hypothetical protein
MTYKFNFTPKDKDESGIVSLIVVTILAIVLSLIAIGFSKLSDRELRQASNRETSAQAFYAAESGLNDAIAYLTAGGTPFSGCTNWPASPVDGNKYFTSDLSGNGVAKYSCLSIDDNPQVLSYDIKPGEPKVIKISAANLQRLYFGWENDAYPSTGPTWLGGVGTLPREDTIASSNPAATGLLRVGIYAVPQGDTSDTNDGLSSLSRLYYMYPNGGGGAAGTIAYGSGSYNVAAGAGGNNGSFVPGNCNNARVNPVPSNNQAIPSYCNTYVSGLDGTTNTYYLYLTAQYAPLLVRIMGTDGSGSNSVKFTGAQGVVDVTGDGSGQIQRIRARVDLTNQYNEPSYAVQSLETLCKDFQVQLVGPSQFGDAIVLDPGDPACTAPTGSGDVGNTAGDKTRH